MVELNLGHTPDADDAFMFYGIASGKVSSRAFEIKHTIEDIETLNKRAIAHELDVTAISAHTYAYIKKYVILRCGASFGLNYGPVIISKKRLTIAELHSATIAIPGRMTSAYLISRIAVGSYAYREMPFHLIPSAVENGEVDAGLLIHEGQITFDRFGLLKVLDLGSWWNTNTDGLAVPLGINVASSETMSDTQIKQFEDLLTSSIRYGLDHFDDALDYAMTYSRGQTRDVIGKFVMMYVNRLTVDMGVEGLSSIQKMFKMASDQGILTQNTSGLISV
ncbi:MAG TPA: MqnA/MqnD/SBP family protein [Nitrososphaeraceae archaeon]|nr:MqnA/MqnD/SBP family protein [Nitrososphaeraceae archaeon]